MGEIQPEDEPQKEENGPINPELAKLQSQIEHAAGDPFDALIKKYKDFEEELTSYKGDPEKICLYYNTRSKRPYAKELMTLSIQLYTWNFLQTASKQGNTVLTTQLTKELKETDMGIFNKANEDFAAMLKTKDLNALQAKNNQESKTPKILEGQEYMSIQEECTRRAIQVGERFGALAKFQLINITSAPFVAMSQWINSYLQIEIAKRNITNRGAYEKVRQIKGPNGVPGLNAVIHRLKDTDCMTGLCTLAANSAELAKERMSIFAYSVDELLPEVNQFMNILSDQNKIEFFDAICSNYNIVPTENDPLHMSSTTPFKIWVLNQYLLLKERGEVSPTGIERAETKGLRTKNATLYVQYQNLKQLEIDLEMAQLRNDNAKAKEIIGEIHNTKEKLVSQSTIQRVLSFDQPKLTAALADPYSRQMIVDTMGSEFGYLLENENFVGSEQRYKYINVFQLLPRPDGDIRDILKVEELTKDRLSNKRTTESYLHPYQELIYTHGLRNTLLLDKFLKENNTTITIGKEKHALLGAPSLMAGILVRYKTDLTKNPYASINHEQITRYVDQLQTDITHFINIPEDKAQTTIIALYPATKKHDPNGAFGNYPKYIETLKDQGYKVVAKKAEDYEKPPKGSTAKFGPEKFIEDVQRKIGEYIIQPLNAGLTPKSLRIMIALHGGENGTADMGGAQFTRKHFEQLVNFSETIKKKYPASAQYFSVVIDSCFSGTKFDESPNFVSNIALASSADVGTSKQTNDAIGSYDPAHKNETDYNGDGSIAFQESWLYSVLHNPDKYMPTSFWDPSKKGTTVLF